MSRQTIALKTRVRYEGRATNVNRISQRDTDLEKFPHPVYYTIGQVLRSKFKPILQGRATPPTLPTKK